MESSLQYASSPFCSGVVDLVSYGHISGRKGVSLLCSFRKMGSPDDRMCAVAALRYLTNISDKRLARSCRIAFHELYTEDMWDLFTLNFEAVARFRLNTRKLPQFAHLLILRSLACLAMCGLQSIYEFRIPLKARIQGLLLYSIKN